MYTGQPNYSIVRSWNKSQGFTAAPDQAYQIPRDIGLRHVSVENSSLRPISIAITPYISGPTPEILTTLYPSEIKDIGINSHGGPPQFLWMLDPSSGKIVGEPVIIQSNSNQLVLRDGVNKWWVHFFSRPPYAAAK